MFKQSVLAGAIALALLPHSVQAIDVVTGNELTNIVVLDGEFTSDPLGTGAARVGVENFDDYWNGGGALVRVYSPQNLEVDADITLGANGGRRLDFIVSGSTALVELHTSITGSAISGEGGVLKVGSDFFDASDDNTIVELGASSSDQLGSGIIPVGHLSEIDSINVNANGMVVRENASITLGENDSFKMSRTWFDLGGGGLVSVPERTVLVNDGLIEQRGANTRVDINGFFNQEGAYVLQGQGSRLNVTYDVNMVGGSTTTFDQYIGTQNIIGEVLTINRGAIYNMYGGQLTAKAIGGVFSRSVTSVGQFDENGVFVSGGIIGVDISLPGGLNNSDSGYFNYTDGGVNAKGTDFYIRDQGMLGQDLVIDAGETFGSKNMYVGTLDDGLTTFGPNYFGRVVSALASGSIVMDGGSNTVAENMVIGQWASMTQNNGFNRIGGNLYVDGGDYTQNGGSNSVGDTLWIGDGGSYTLNGGNLTVGRVASLGSSTGSNTGVGAKDGMARTYVTGQINYINGGVRLTNSNLYVSQNGALGDSLLIDEGETFGAVNMTVGTLSADSGSINQSTGRNIIQNELRIEAGGSYIMSGGTLEFGSFAGSGVIDFTAGEINVGSDLSIGANGPFGETVLLDASKTLSLQKSYRDPRNNLTIDTGASLVLDGGYLTANQISNNGSFDYVSGVLDLNSLTFGGSGPLGSFTAAGNRNLFVRNDITIEAGTTVNVGDINGGSGSLSGGAIVTNRGNLVLNNGTLNVSQINNVGAGRFDFNSGRLSLDTLSIGSSGLLGQTVSLNASKSISSNNVIVESGSQLQVTGGSSSISNLTNQGDVVVMQNGILNGSAYTQDNATASTVIDGTLNANVTINEGLLGGSGTINGNLFNSSDFTPGNSPGTMVVNGDFTQSATGTLFIELGGLLSGSEYDVVDVSGMANLAGTLDVSLYDFGSGLFSVELGDTFEILTAETIVGEFDLLTLAVLGTGLGWDLNYVLDDFGKDYLNLSVVEVSSVPVPAAVWLFGSGLIGLIGFARRRK